MPFNCQTIALGQLKHMFTASEPHAYSSASFSFSAFSATVRASIIG